MNKFICLTGLFFALTLNSIAQELSKLQLSLDSLSVIGFNRISTKTYPLFSYEEDNVLKQSNDSSNQRIQLQFNIGESDNKGVNGIIEFINTSKDTISIKNIVPFGANPNHTYITGKGTHYLSRSHLFRPGKKAVNVILPDNAWELGYSGFSIRDVWSVTSLTRRKDWDKAKRRRFETILEPGGSVRYHFYADLYKGNWQEGLRKMFQERHLYDLDSFDNTLYEREDLKWIRSAYVMHLIMAWDQRFYDRSKDIYSVESFLERGQALYGGDDVIGIWPTWPTLGMDHRNQFDLFRDLPGGLDALKDLSKRMKEQNTKLFLCYNPWDDSSRAEGHMDGLSDLISNTDADGVVLDTTGESSSEYQDAADRVKDGVIMYSEGMAIPKNMQGIVSGRVHNALYYPPFLNLNKFIKPEFAIFRVAELYKEPIQREFAISFFNGHGTELNIFRPGDPSWIEKQYRYLGRTTKILRENAPNFNSYEYTPLIQTLEEDIYVNKWPLKDKIIYSVFSLKAEGFKGPLFEVNESKGTHFVDLWHHKELLPIQKNGKSYIEVQTDAFNSFDLGTNNEAEVDCIAQLPIVLQTNLYNNHLTVNASRGDQIKVWAGAPSYGKSFVELSVKEQHLNITDHFVNYQGPIVIQLFEKGILIDENIWSIPSGEPLLVSNKEQSPAAAKEKGMVLIPEGKFTFKTTNGDSFIPYTNFREGKQYQMNSFLMDQYPVTNAQFKKFIQKSNYLPSDPTNYLKHWEQGEIPEGMENKPVVYISFEDAKAYAKWAKKRLPTELEWQYAAQTSDLREWPWSVSTKDIYREKEEITNTLTVFKIKGIDPQYCNLGDGTLKDVGSHPKGANPFGLEDLVGSVWQLTNDVYTSGSYNYIILKGGSYYNPASSWWYVQGGPRELHYREHLLRLSQGFERNATVGFRCVKDHK